MATSNEHFNAKDIDKQIEQALAQARPNESNTQLVADLQRLHQADAQADARSLNYAWQHIRARQRSQRSLDNKRKVISMHIPSASLTQGKNREEPRSSEPSPLSPPCWSWPWLWVAYSPCSTGRAQPREGIQPPL